MLDHAEILVQIESIKDFFHSIGLKKIKDIPEENWNLDSSYKFIPAKDRFTITYLGKERVLLSVDVFIVGGLHFIMRGTSDVSLYETIKTDYNFKSIHHQGCFFKDVYRDWQIKKLLYENT
jgi:hypothetical protein